MKLEEFIDALYAAGWTAPHDAQWTQISGVHATMIARAEAAEAERDAYKRAKAENDERFMTERDEARAEVARLRAALRTITGRYEYVCTYNDDGWAGPDHWNAIADAQEILGEE